MSSKTFRYLKGLGILAIFSLSLADAAGAQTIRGILMETGTERRIQLGEMILVGQGGDTIDVTYTNDAGGFELTSPEPGDFLVLADALGMHLDAFQRLSVDPCSMSIVRYTKTPGRSLPGMGGTKG